MADSMSVFPRLPCHTNHRWGSCYNVIDSDAGLEWGFRFCISNKLPDDGTCICF